MLKEKLKMMNGVLENGNYQLGQFKLIELENMNLLEEKHHEKRCVFVV